MGGFVYCRRTEPTRPPSSRSMRTALSYRQSEPMHETPHVIRGERNAYQTAQDLREFPDRPGIGIYSRFPWSLVVDLNCPRFLGKSEAPRPAERLSDLHIRSAGQGQAPPVKRSPSDFVLPNEIA